MSHAAHRAPTVVLEPRQTLQLLLTGLAALILTSIVGLVGYFVVVEQLRTPSTTSSVRSTPAEISSRAVDPAPLTRQEVFPAPEIQLVAGAPPYRVSVTHMDSDCAQATSGELTTMLADNGCDQIVRATMTAPYGGYEVTAGIFNLDNDIGAEATTERAGNLIESGRGTFTPIGALGSFGDEPTGPVAQAGWRARGHFLIYCLISRPDGRLVGDDDPYAGRITADIIDQYLVDKVVNARSRNP
ncbi:hypothetical protein [Actinoplanes sp. NPDC051494]|uniref:hypothetical protein n=1 Tax=Actinoplanes sp. NPDC051494 TaxID=3363907 RepID=UPI00379A71AF